MLRQILGVQKFDVAIICVDNKKIQHINRIYRKKNIPTDVLSFPYHEVQTSYCLVYRPFMLQALSLGFIGKPSNMHKRGLER